MMEIINLTPHALNLFTECGERVIESSGLARCTASVELDTVVDGIKLCRTTYGDVVGLPPAKEGVIYVVSGMVLSALAGSRSDVFGPADLVRDENGRVVGARALTR